MKQLSRGEFSNIHTERKKRIFIRINLLGVLVAIHKGVISSA